MTDIKQIYCNDVLFSPYSRWHRNQTHSCIAMMDVDKVSCCNACNEPLFLAETVMDKGQEKKKGHTMVRKLALKAKLPAFIIWYKLIGEQIPICVYVKKIAPEYKNGYASPPERKTFNQWQEYLEHKQVEHFPNCEKQWLFIKKLKEDPIASKRRIYAPILYK